MKRRHFIAGLTLALSGSLFPLISGCSREPSTDTTASTPAAGAPLTIGYSDWPGWVAWQVAIDKGWLKEAGLNVEFKWFDYAASLAAFSAGQLDGVLATNGDDLVNSAGGGRGIMTLITDYSNGNDMIIGKPGVTSIPQLKGKTVSVEQGLVEHLLLANALKKSGMSLSDVHVQNGATSEMPQILASGRVDAVGAWQPVAGQALKQVPGSTPIYTSKDQPGLIYDVLAVTPKSLGEHREEWQKLVNVWDRVVNFINDPATQPEALKIMAARTGVTPEAYAKFLGGTKLLTLAENKQAMKDADGFSSLYGSSRYVNDFNVANGTYKTPLDVKTLIDPGLVMAAP